jgi:hypothetical protein
LANQNKYLSARIGRRKYRGVAIYKMILTCRLA